MLTIQLPYRTLLVLCGPAGSGKSTFAASHFGRTTIVSSDLCRELICDDAANQQVNRDTFDLFYYIIHKRLYLGRFTVADSTALHANARQKLLEIARHYSYFACLLIFNTPETLCRERNLQRERRVEEQVFPYHARLLQQALQDAPSEGWNLLHVLGEEEMNSGVEFEIT